MDSKNASSWAGVLAAAVICLPASFLLVVTGLRYQYALPVGAGVQIPDWLQSICHAIGPTGILVSFLLAAFAVALIPIVFLLRRWRAKPTVSDQELREALGTSKNWEAGWR